MGCGLTVFAKLLEAKRNAKSLPRASNLHSSREQKVFRFHNHIKRPTTCSQENIRHSTQKEHVSPPIRLLARRTVEKARMQL